jgi:uncharacterized protein (DUF1330 family)
MSLSPYALYYNENRIIPAPTLSIEKSFVYTNDAVSGYTYVVNLRGYASAINPQFNYSTNESNIDRTVRSIDRIHTVFHKNGGKFLVTCNNVPVLEGNGGQLRSFSVSDTDNNWVNYAEYNVSLEFNDFNIYSQLNNIPNIEIAADTVNGIMLNVPDLTDYALRIKEYKDSWSFNTSDEEAHAYYSIIGNEGVSTLSEDYTTINVSYKIDATGKHFFEPNGVLIPSWDRAKQFVQEKLASQIYMFRRDIGAFSSTEDGMVLSNNTTRTGFPLADSSQDRIVIPYDSTPVQLPEDLLINAHTGYATPAVPTNPPLLGFLLTQGYGIFNENVLCETSESNGTFSATYSCILKKIIPGNDFMRDATHKYNITYEETNDFDSSVRNISIDGTIQGLLPTNILKSNGFVNDGTQLYLSLPSNGVFIVSSPNISNKYYYAWYHFTKDLVNESFSDLKDVYKQALSINYASLFPYTSSDIPCVEDENGGYLQLFQLLAKPRTFSISHNYTEGSVTYSAAYDTERSCSADRGFEDLTVTEEESVPILAEFVVPGRSAGPIIQNLETYTNKKITLSFTGTTKKGCIEGNPWQEQWAELNPGKDLFDFVELNLNIPPIVNGIILTTEKGAETRGRKLIKSTDSYNYNPIDGSFSVNVSYIVCPAYSGGCEIVDS